MDGWCVLPGIGAYAVENERRVAQRAINALQCPPRGEGGAVSASSSDLPECVT
jgi:hypothetical protein